jgi:hypothetical protein
VHNVQLTQAIVANAMMDFFYMETVVQLGVNLDISKEDLLLIYVLFVAVIA